MRLLESDFKILTAVPRSLTYTQIAKRTNFSQPYVSARIKKLKEEGIAEFGFRIDFWAAGYIPTYVIADYEPGVLESLKANCPPNVFSIRLMYTGVKQKLLIKALVPEREFDDFIANLPVKHEVAYRCNYDATWRADVSKLARYSDGRVVVDIQAIPAVYEESPDKWEEMVKERVSIDELDYKVIWGKMHDLFTPLAAIAAKAKASQQLVSYHYRYHVLKLWTYNAVILYLDRGTVPIFLVRIELADLPSAIKMLNTVTQIPYFHESFIPMEEPFNLYAIVQMPSSEYLPFLDSLRKIPAVKDLKPLGILRPDVYIKCTNVNR